MSRLIILILLLLHFTLDLPRDYQSQIIETDRTELSVEPAIQVVQDSVESFQLECLSRAVVHRYNEAPLQIDRSLPFNQHIDLPPPSLLS